VSTIKIHDRVEVREPGAVNQDSGLDRVEGVILDPFFKVMDRHVLSCWEICNVQRFTGNGQTSARRVQNREEENAETKGEGKRVELSLLVFNLGVQCYILSIDGSMSIQH
jgi:hypothetical protein